MQITELYYIRHAEPDFTVHDDLTRPLTEKGRRDSLRLPPLFSDIPLDAAYSSPFARAVETIRPIAEQANLEIQLDSRLRERKVGSGWIEDFTPFAKNQWADFSYKLPEGESLNEVETRNMQILWELLHAHPGKRILVGGHGTALCTILHFFFPSFGYEDFCKIGPVMPLGIRFLFQGKDLLKVEKLDFGL